MDVLILQRHAKAVADSEAQTDRRRGLTERGQAAAAAAAVELHKAGLQADIALVSPALRTRETFEIARKTFKTAAAREDEQLYMAEAETLWMLAQQAGAAHVWIVGHNPGLHDLVRHLLRHAADRSRLAQDLMDRFPTAAFAAFALAGDAFEAPGPRLLAAWTH